jgi:peptidyl-prolyl cis-trans isomerase B (cyclophilin B)
LSIFKYRATASGVAVLLLSLVLLAACGDSTATSPASGTATPGAASSPSGTTSTVAPVFTAAGTGAANNTTTAATGGGVTVGTVSGATVSSACVDLTAATATTAAANAPKPTPASTAQAAIPNLAIAGTRQIKAADATSKSILSNLNDSANETAFGKFTADQVAFSFSSDSYDKIDAAYRKLLEDAGWQQFRYETDAPTKESLLVYQKDGSKVVLNIINVTDITGYPTEFKEFYKEGDSLILASSGKAASSTPEPTAFAIPGTPTQEVKPGQHKYATIELEKGGKIVIELCPNLAPKTVENFEKLATKGFYNGLTFHRVEKSPTPFVVQGGDPKGDGTGGPGYSIPDEFTTLKKHTRGTVAMAHSQAANSAGSQFYICLDAASFLDGKYAIFGQVTEGMDLVDKIAVGDKMKSVTIEVK